jgi:nitrate reductase delta subunit
MAPEQVHPLKLASLLLQYPVAEIVTALGAVEREDLEGLGRSRPGVEPLLAEHGQMPLAELQKRYVATFDFSKQRALYLTYHLHGDRRQRGLALLRLKQAYAAAGFELRGSELPDYLPVMLEFAALEPSAGEGLLEEHRVAIELVRAGLREMRSPYLVALDLIVERLGGMTRRQVAKLRRLAADGPPSEEVGLEPFAPPEAMPPAGEPPPGLEVPGGIA